MSQTAEHLEISDVADYMHDLGRRARRASRDLAAADTAAENDALHGIADELDARREPLLAANRQDLEAGAAKAAGRMPVRREKFRIRSGKEVTGIVWVIDDDGDAITIVELQQIDRHLRISREERLLTQQALTRDVVRGLAHEIKNPLTPIQLSAERLRRKYLGTMEAEDADVLERLPGKTAIGHVRYSTAGGGQLANAQPIMVQYAKGDLAIAHNGNLTNASQLRDELEASGSIFQTTVDS